MLTIYNFSLHKSPQQGYDRQKKKCKTTISPLLTFNLKVGFTFSVLSPLACFAANGNVSAHWKHAFGESIEKVEKRNFRAVGNGILWLTPCKLAVRAQLGDKSKYSGERRRRSVVVASMVLTITDPLRGSQSLWCYLQAALIRSCGASFACMELTIISRFQRLQASTKSLPYSLFL